MKGAKTIRTELYLKHNFLPQVLSHSFAVVFHHFVVLVEKSFHNHQTYDHFVEKQAGFLCKVFCCLHFESLHFLG